MAENFIGEIRIVGFPYAPKGWADCDGRLMPITQNTALFAILDKRFGGDGKQTFALPNFKGRAAVGQGKGEGLVNYDVGDQGGALEVTLKEAELPYHTHQGQASSNEANVQAPGPDRALARSTPGFAYQGNTQEDMVKMSPQSTSSVGSGKAHTNISPCTVMRYCIALQGTFPPRG